uniref:Uncharacterized protein n=1 Tax=Arundo donax TaxID=35708 RepID=A0A0A9A1N6_ARUDO
MTSIKTLVRIYGTRQTTLHPHKSHTENKTKKENNRRS